MMEYVAIFKNSRTVMMADQACKGANLKIAVIATPSDISSECGMSLKFGDLNHQKFQETMAKAKIDYKIYERK